MKKLLLILLLVHASAFAQIKETPPKFDFRSINVAQAVQLIYSEALTGAYVIDPDVLTDQRQVSFRYDASQGDLRAFIDNFFDSIGLTVSRRGSVDYVTRKPQSEGDLNKAGEEIFVYRPKYRDGSYLTDILSPLFHGSFTAKKAVHAPPGDKAPEKATPADSAASAIDRKSDTLVFQGTAKEIERMKKFLPLVDIPVGDVSVRGVVYEVQTGSNDGTAVGLALSLLGGKLGVNLGSVASSSGSALTFKSQTIDGVLSSLSNDSRFKVISTPTLRVSSGGEGRFTVGQDVPVLGAVTYTGAAGAPVQSVEYRSSGVIFDLKPVLHESTVDLTVMQQISDFAATDTGVNGSPTLTKREINTSLTMNDGELIVIGGLTQSKDTDSHDGLSFLPSFLHTTSASKQKTEILLVLQLTKV